MKKILMFMCVCVFLATAVEGYAVTKTTSVQQPKKTAKIQKKIFKKKHKRYVAPAPHASIESIPIVLPIPEEVTEALKMNDLGQAARVLRMERQSSKGLHLLREIQRILEFDAGRKPSSPDKDQFYRNLGIAYHNLYLFLKKQGIINDSFYKFALKYYKKSGGSLFDKYHTKVLIAALMATAGDLEAARKHFQKVDISMLEDSYLYMLDVASYFAATDNAYDAVGMLKKAYAMKPEEVKLWLMISDDYAGIENESAFQSLLTGWHIKEMTREPTLRVPLSNKKPKLN